MKRKKLSLTLKEEKINNKTNFTTDSKQQEIKTSLKRKLDANNGSEIDNKIPNKSLKVSFDIKNEDLFEKSNQININTINKSDNNSSEINSNLINKEMKEVLPQDFFDNPNELTDNNSKTDSKNSEMESNMDSDMASNSLPKGFFDDPVLDAKARHVPFKDPIDEEWDKFQKVIAEETTTSQNIIEEDVEEIQVDRNLIEIEEQISSWAKVEEMQKKAEELHNNCVNNELKSNDIESSDSSDIDDQEMDVFSNWRNRGALNSK
jgi:zinc finger protein 830